MSVAQATGGGYIELIRSNRNFRQLWFGQIVSLLGDWFNLIGSAALIASMTQSGFAVGGLFVVRMLAPFLVSPLAGVAADRYDRRKLLIITDIVRAIIVLGFLLVRDPSRVWMLYVLTFFQLAVSGFFFPTRSAILPDIVEARSLGAANAISSATWSVMLALGAALGGLVAGRWGVYTAFFVDSLTFMASALLIAGVAYPHKVREATDTRLRAIVQQYVTGLRYLKQHADILVISLQKAAISLTSAGGFQVLQVAIAERVFVIGDGGGISLGLLYTGVGIGTGIGPILARRFTGDRDWPLRVAIAISYGITGIGLLLVAPLSNFGLTLFGSFLRGFGGGIGWVFSTQLLLELVPDQVRGRVFASEFAMFTLASATAAAGTGWAMDSALGLSGTIWWMIGLNFIPGILWVWWLVIRGKKVQT